MAQTRPDTYFVASASSLYAGGDALVSPPAPPPPSPPPPPPAPTLALSGPTTATVGVQTANYQVTASNLVGGLVVTPQSTLSAAFSPSTVNPAPGELTKLFAAVFAAAGSHQVKVTAGGGIESNTVAVTVSQAPPPPPPPPPGTTITALQVVSTAAGTFPYSATVLPLRGQVPSGSQLQSVADPSMRSSILSTHNDGSAAVVVVAGSVAVSASSTTSIDVQFATATADSALTTSAISTLVNNLSVAFNGNFGTASLTNFSSPERVWWANAQTICARYRVAVSNPGSTALELVVDIHAWATGRALVEVSVENCKLSGLEAPNATPPSVYTGRAITTPAAASYTSAVVTVNGVAAVTANGNAAPEGNHAFARAWYASAWVGGNPGMRVTQAHADLQKHPLLFKCDQTATFDMTAYAADAYAPWSTGRHRASGMSAGGDHPSIGPLPQWESRALQSGDARAWNAVEVSSLAVLGYNINYRDAATGLVPCASQLVKRTQVSSEANFPGAGADAMGWETAHSPAAGLMAFIARPSPVFIELAQKITVWNATRFGQSTNLSGWTGAVSLADNTTGVYGVSDKYQIRGHAWGLRALAHATFLSPNGSDWREGGRYWINRNSIYLNSWRVNTKDKLNVLWDGAPDSPTSIYVTRPAGSSFGTAAMQNHYLVTETHKVASAQLLTGADQAALVAFADWLALFPVRWVNEQTDGRWRYISIGVAMGRNASTIDSPLTWGLMREYSYPSQPGVGNSGTWFSTGFDEAPTIADYTAENTAGGYYPSYFWSALTAAVERGVTGARAAWSTVLAGINNINTWRAGFAADPRWGTTPRAGLAPFYEGDGTFNTLQGVRDAIASTGGWAQLPNTKLSDVLPTAAQLDAISPRPVLRGDTWPNSYYAVWGSAAWTGHAFFLGATGGHYAYWGNDMACIRIADPPQVTHRYLPAPIQAVQKRGSSGIYPAGSLVPSAGWGSLYVSGDVEHSWPTWGPRATHQYSGVIWHAATRKVILGGSNQTSCRNPSAVGDQALMETRVWAYDPTVNDPQQAWSSAVVNASGADGIFGLVVNTNGTVSMRTFSGNLTLTVNAMTLVAGNVGPSPIYDAYSPWRNCVQDLSTGKSYELHRTDLGASYTNPPYRLSIFDVSTGNYVAVAQLPAEFLSQDVDRLPGIVIVYSVAYVWGQSSTVARVALATGAVQSYTSAEAMPSPPAGYNGVWGRWTYVPQAQCFVGLPSETSNAYVFRPPSGWL